MSWGSGGGVLREWMAVGGVSPMWGFWNGRMPGHEEGGPDTGDNTATRIAKYKKSFQ